MSQIIQLRRGTAAQWTTANPILADGEAGLEKDTGKIKFGDGVADWATLEYFVGTALPIDVDGALIANSDAVVPSQKAVVTYVSNGLTNLRSEILDGVDPAWNTFLELRAGMLADESAASALATLVGAKAPSASPTFTGVVDLSAATLVGHILPNALNSYDLGSAGAAFKDIYASHVLYMNGVQVLTTRQTNVADIAGLGGPGIAGTDTVSIAVIEGMIGNIVTALNAHLNVTRTHGLM